MKAARFSIVEIRIGDDDDLVARHRKSCSRAVQADDTGTGSRFDDVGRKTRAGVDIDDRGSRKVRRYDVRTRTGLGPTTLKRVQRCRRWLSLDLL